jgi:hypothetical protein
VERATLNAAVCARRLDLKLGDLNQESKESLEIAQKKPDLKRLDADVKAWFEKRKRLGTMPD